MTLSVKTDAQISFFYNIFLSHVIHIPFSTCCAIWDHEGTRSFLFQFKEHEKGCTWHSLKTSPLRSLASGACGIMLPSSAHCLASSSSLQFPKLSLDLKAAYQLLSLNFYLFPAWVQPSYFVYLFPRPRHFFINRLFFFNVSNVRGLNYQYLHIKGLPPCENVNKTLTTLPRFFPRRTKF